MTMSDAMARNVVKGLSRIVALRDPRGASGSSTRTIGSLCRCSPMIQKPWSATLLKVAYILIYNCNT
jgi:hypothetical protein